MGRGVSGALVAMRLADRMSVKSVTAHHRDRGSHAWTGTRPNRFSVIVPCGGRCLTAAGSCVGSADVGNLWRR